jgi:hypothetical protein
MNLKRFFALTTILLSVFSNLAAQSHPSKETTKQEQKEARAALEKKALALVEDVLKEAASLKMPENRIRVQATAADILWPHDEKRARALFKQAAEGYVELAANDETPSLAELSAGLDPAMGQILMARSMGTIQSRVMLRQEILQMLTKHDVRLARDFLRATSGMASGQNSYFGPGDWEKEMEVGLAAQIAEKDPKQALEIAEESLDRGLSQGVMSVITQLQQKDKELAAKLVSAVVKKIRSEDFNKNYAAASIALALLGADSDEGDYDKIDSHSDNKKAGSNNQPILDEKATRELLDRLIPAALREAAEESDHSEMGAPYLLLALGSIIPVIEKYAPAHAPALKKKLAEINKQQGPEMETYKDSISLLKSNDPDVLLEAASKAPSEMRSTFTSRAVEKAIEQGDYDRARQIINEHVGDAEQRKQMLAMLDRQTIQRAVAQIKLDEVRPVLARLRPEERAALLAQFAAALAAKGDKKFAIQILDEARFLFGAQATNHVELRVMLQIAECYGSIESARAFEIIEPTIDQLNNLLAAVASLEGFDAWQSFKDGELIGIAIHPVVTLTLQCVKSLPQLSRIDFDRAKAVAERFSRQDVRILAQLSVVKGVLSERASDLPSAPIVPSRYDE